ncbi:hypothetical protein IAD21_05974 [Abditibacteriota bacterium]|nr:hypothetical protein IAD21_05974 [Abditibacteriota bacterium]
MTEQDLRLSLLNTLLTTPHRDMAALYPLHRNMMESDPRFYARLAAWYGEKGDVRDHREMFVVNLCLSSFEGHREVGLSLLRRLPPYQVARVVDFIKGTPARPAKARKPVKSTSETQTLVARATRLLTGRGAKKRVQTQRAAKKSLERATPKGLGHNVPRSMKTEIEVYLRSRENDAPNFDGAVLHARSSLKRLYAGLHIAPGPRAQAILFDDCPPADSKLAALKEIAASSDPSFQARAIAQNRIPYRVAVSVIKTMTPMVLASLVNAMSPQETINNIASLKKRGAFDSPDIKPLIEGKLAQARNDGRVSAFKAKVAGEAAGANGALAAQLDAITDAQVKAKGSISRPTALFIDKSGSMDVAIEVGKQLGAMVSSICESDLFVYAFDTMPYPIEVTGDSLSAWEKGLQGIQAVGATSCGTALAWMEKKQQRVEQIVMISDERENKAPFWKDTLKSYQENISKVDVVFVKVGNAGDALERDCETHGVSFRAFDFKGDYYALTNLLPLLVRPSMLELLMEILEYPLPVRS